MNSKEFFPQPSIGQSALPETVAQEDVIVDPDGLRVLQLKYGGPPPLEPQSHYSSRRCLPSRLGVRVLRRLDGNRRQRYHSTLLSPDTEPREISVLPETYEEIGRLRV